MLRRIGWIALAAGVAWLGGTAATSQRALGRPAPRAAIVPISGKSPFDPGCIGQQTGSVILDSAVEPYIAADANRPGHMVGVWQQDRWTNGGASGVLAAVSLDGGWNWTTTGAAFTRCTGGAWDRASDPWVTIAPDGTVYQSALGLKNVAAPGQSNSVLVSRSSDGGLTWSSPITLIQDNDGSDDKESITADPHDSRYVYAIWDRPIGSNRQPALFSRTTDGGASWEPSRIIYDPGANAYTSGNVIVVLPDTTLVDVLALYQAQTPSVAVIRSANRGQTWSAPVIISSNQSVGTLDTKTRTSVRAGSGLPAAAVDRNSGTIYVAWQDARFSGGRHDGIALSKSTDGGLTWLLPLQVNQAPDFQAFTPAVAVGADGRIAVTYYDFRNDTVDPTVLLTNRWQVVSLDGGSTWRETPVAGTFDLRKAPALTGGALFLGDYQGLTASANTLVSFFSAAAAPSTVFAIPTTSERPTGAAARSTPATTSTRR